MPKSGGKYRADRGTADARHLWRSVRTLAKALWFDGSGWCILAKRLEAGSFQLPPLPADTTRIQIDGAAFASLLAGIDFTASRKGWFRRVPST